MNTFYIQITRVYEGVLKWGEFVCVLRTLKGVLPICQKSSKLLYRLLNEATL